MSVHLKHLNADSTFLLTFSLPTATGEPSRDGVFTVLTDPWLAESGAPQIHAKFAFAARKVPAHVNHLSQIPAPDVVVISQPKPDHCHEDTLRQLPADLPKTTILAHPDAARKIRSWKYFDPAKVHSLRNFSDNDHSTMVRFTIPVRIPGASAGEATITLLKQPRDLTKLHNAIAITYRPPMGCVPSTPGTPTGVQAQPRAQSSAGPSEENKHVGVQLRAMLSSPALKQHEAQYEPQMVPQAPLTPPETPPESEQDPAEQARTPVMNFSLPRRNQRQRSRTLSSLASPPAITTSQPSGLLIEGAPALSLSPPTPSASQTPARPWTRAGDSAPFPPPSSPPTVPLPPIPNTAPLVQTVFSPALSTSDGFESPLDSIQRPSGYRARSLTSVSALHSPKTVSVLYAPHGIEFSAVKLYAQTHLVQAAALPLTLILHPFARVDNPWWLGGNISAGVPGALEIVRRLMAKNWISAHDEEKEESGVGVKMLKRGHWNERQVKGLLGKGLCEVKDLDCGEETRIVA